MNRKLKLVLAALLGFSGACSSLKNAPQSSDPSQPAGVEIDQTDSLRRIQVMYGVPNPRVKETAPVSKPLPAADSLRKPVNRHPARLEVDPVAEEPKD